MITPSDCNYCGQVLDDAYVHFDFHIHVAHQVWRMVHRYHPGCWFLHEESIRKAINDRNDGLCGSVF